MEARPGAMETHSQPGAVDARQGSMGVRHGAVDAQPREVDVHPQQGCRAGTRTGQNHIHLRSPELYSEYGLSSAYKNSKNSIKMLMISLL
jgi:hypothetical protein